MYMSTATYPLPHLSAWHSIDLGHVSPADSLVYDLPVMITIMMSIMILMKMMVLMMIMMMVIRIVMDDEDDGIDDDDGGACI